MIQGHKTENTVLIYLVILLIAAIPACSELPTPTAGAIETQINGLQTEQAILHTQLAQLEPTATAAHTPTLKPSPTSLIKSSPTVIIETSPPLLPRPVYYLKPDASGVSQVFRLEVDGVTQSQITSETRPVLDYDVSISGEIAYIVQGSAEEPLALILASDTGGVESTVEERSSEEELLLNVRWLPNGEQLVYHRTTLVEESAAAGGQPTAESKGFIQELVLYNPLTGFSEVLLRTGDEKLSQATATLYTDESIEYDSENDWQVTYKVNAFSPDGRYLLVSDSGGPFWMVYDLRFHTMWFARIIASSADFSPDGKLICLTSDFTRPGFTPHQALLCGDFTANTLTVYLKDPPWNPFGINLWFENKALVFLKFTSSEENEAAIQLYGLNLNESEPILLQEDPWQVDDPDVPTVEFLYSPDENQTEGLVILAGQSVSMDSPGLVILPVDPQKPIITIPEVGQVHQLRWGPPFLP